MSTRCVKSHSKYCKNILQNVLPYYRVNIPIVHGQFNNSLPFHFTPKRYLENLPSLYDLEIFNLNHNIHQHIDPNLNSFTNQFVRCRYFSPNSFYKTKNDLGLNVLSDTKFIS